MSSSAEGDVGGSGEGGRTPSPSPEISSSRTMKSGVPISTLGDMTLWTVTR